MQLGFPAQGLALTVACLASSEMQKKVRFKMLKTVDLVDKGRLWGSSGYRQSDVTPDAYRACDLGPQSAAGEASPPPRPDPPSEPAACARSSADSGPGSRASRSQGLALRWRGAGSTRCCC